MKILILLKKEVSYMSSINIPRLNLLDYTEGSAEQRHRCSQDIGKAFHETGFVTIANHGMDKALIGELYSVVQRFFALPESIKATYEIPGMAGQRGYTSKGKEKAKDAKVPDLKEFWQRGQDDNPLVNELPRFDEVTGEVFRRLETTGRELLKAISLYLGLDEDYFEPKVVQGNSILRAIHYFPI